MRGGAGTLRYELDGDGVREVLEPGEVSWASVEHNVDAYFFLRALTRATDVHAYADAAGRIAAALTARPWSGEDGQLVAGIGPDRVDPTLALDCAAWGAVFLGAAGEGARADTALAVADARCASANAPEGPGHPRRARAASRAGRIAADVDAGRPVLARHGPRRRRNRVGRPGAVRARAIARRRDVVGALTA